MNCTRRLFVFALCLALAACAASIKEQPERLVSRYRDFLLADGQPFDARMSKYLGLIAEDDIRQKPQGFFTRYGPRRGAAIWFAVASSIDYSDNYLTGQLVTSFDSSVACIQREHIRAQIGQIVPAREVPLQHPLPTLRAWVIPEHVPENAGTPRLDLHFTGDCLDRVDHSVRIPL